MFRLSAVAFSLCLMNCLAQTPPPATQTPIAARPVRPPAPTRDPHTAGYVTAKELPDGEVPAPTADGNFIIGPTHNPAPEMIVKEDVPHGTISSFTMESK